MAKLKPEQTGIALKVIFNQARTTTDGGWRITFDVDQSQAAQIQELTSLFDKVLNLVILKDNFQD